MSETTHNTRPDFTVCIGTAEEYAKGKRAWTRIGAAWRGSNDCLKIKLAFPVPMIISETTMLTLFPFKEEA